MGPGYPPTAYGRTVGPWGAAKPLGPAPVAAPNVPPPEVQRQANLSYGGARESMGPPLETPAPGGVPPPMASQETLARVSNRPGLFRGGQAEDRLRRTMGRGGFRR